MTLPPLDPAQVRALAAELRKLAFRVINRTFQRVGQHGPLDLPNLFRIVSVLKPGEWQADKIGALRNLMQSTVYELPEDELIPDTRVDWRWTVEALFNLIDLDVDHLPGRKYDKIMHVVVERAELGKQARNQGRDITEPVRVRLAQILLRMEQAALGQYAKQAASSANGTGSSGRLNALSSEVKEPTFIFTPVVDRRIPYIARPEYVRMFEERLNRGDKIIPFVGEPGNGKSRLADFLIDKHLFGVQTRIDIRADNPSTLRRYLSGMLVRLGKLQDADTTTEQLVRTFALYLCSEDAPDYFFIDNLETRNYSKISFCRWLALLS